MLKVIINILQNLTYYASLAMMSIAFVLTALFLFSAVFKRKAIFITSVSFFLVANMLICSILYGLGFGNQAFLDTMYNISNGGLCLLVPIFLVALKYSKK